MDAPVLAMHSSSDPQAAAAIKPRSPLFLSLLVFHAILHNEKLAAQDVSITGDVDPSPSTTPIWDLGASNLTVGDTADGSLSIGGIGAVTNATGFIGGEVGTTGSVTVTGGTWTNTSNLAVGQFGTGILDISGGQVSNAFGYIGNRAGSTGTATVSGGIWSHSGTLNVGNLGAGTLEVSGTGNVNSANTTIANIAGSSGALHLNGGVLSTGQVQQGAGTGSVYFDGGTLQLTGDQADLFSGFAAGGVVIGDGGATIDTQGFSVATSLSLQDDAPSPLSNSHLTKIGSGTLTLNGSSSINIETVINGGTLQFGETGALSNRVGSIGRDVGSTGTVILNSGSWINPDRLVVGEYGTGTLEISGTGAVHGGYISVGRMADSTGTIKVSGGALTTDDLYVTTAGLFVGDAGTGTLEISDTGVVDVWRCQIGQRAGSDGTATLTGGSLNAASMLRIGVSGTGRLAISGGSVNSLDIFVGSSVAGSGTFSVSGGTVTIRDVFVVGFQGTGIFEISSGQVSTVGSYIAQRAGSTGTATVSGGTWSHSDALSVGTSGTGTLEISGGQVSNVSGYIGNNAGSTGTARVSGGTWATSGNLAVGHFGTGILEISDGQVSNAFGYIGNRAGSTGTATVSGGTWSHSGDLNVGTSGNGTLVINGTGAVSNVDGYISKTTTGEGTAVISGGTWTNSGILTVGHLGTGSLEINGTGAVTNGGGFIGRNAGSVGSAKVSSGTWNNVGSLIVGESGSGTLEISGTGAVSNSDGVIGSESGSTGLVRVSGGTWNHSSNLFVGVNGSGTLEISGGTVSNDSGIIGQFGFFGPSSDSAGMATESGGLWENSDALIVGADSTGTLEINGTGRVTSPNTVIADQATGIGALHLNGGVLSTGQVRKGAGTGSLSFDGGTLELTGNQANLFNGFATGAVTLAAGGGTINTESFTVATSQSIQGGGGLTKDGSGTLTLNSANTYSGRTEIAAGTLQLSETGSIHDSSEIDIASGAKFNVSTYNPSGYILGTAQTLTGNGMVMGNLIATGTIAPGNSTGELEFTGNLLLDAATLIQMELASTTVFDRLIVGGMITYDGTLNLSFLDGYKPSEGESFELFQGFISHSGTFDQITVSNPGYTTDFDYATGQLTFTGVPEPTTLAFLGLTALGTLTVRRRHKGGSD